MVVVGSHRHLRADLQIRKAGCWQSVTLGELLADFLRTVTVTRAHRFVQGSALDRLEDRGCDIAAFHGPERGQSSCGPERKRMQSDPIRAVRRTALAVASNRRLSARLERNSHADVRARNFAHKP